MRRWVSSDVELSTGFTIKAGSRVTVDSSRMWNPNVYPQAEEWQADRFLRLRQEHGQEHVAQLVSTSANHFGFGYGQHACPGRFFAAAEIKIALCHLIYHYDWQLAPETSASPMVVGFSAIANPTAKLLVRQRYDAAA